ncbi:hypothetical protein UK23_20405 [Lentzea aerocolonigenes]|uniref:DUF2716 domain-containing protein n=1 Tax=Lentzea aerocolonigenes TaxID=68170 RepID=A0A0F0GZJ4_LENAE|nr:DUF2716 domain-containing protein [Lentzea aerocolonigenes]KJK47412.1 hypothetical protein UK23_20405 [Lentzea aerocolonigenes]
MRSEAWTEVDYRRVWDAFYERFHFKPSIYPKDWPTITEPQGSVTLDLAGIFQSDQWVRKSLTVDEVVLESFLRVYPEETALLALDWQHPAYRFRPHLLGGPNEWLDSPFSPFPDGDYHIFLTEDMSQGTFGHPWEQTLCVWGDDLVRDLVPELDVPVKRAQR